jgi:hypothetical protein
MRSTVGALAIVMATATLAATGCAHGGGAPLQARQEARGSLQLATGPRLLVTGPASHVHTSVNGARPVSLFIVDVVNGDDGDCTGAVLPAAVVASESTHQLRVPRGRVLCAVSSAPGASAVPTELLWHAHREPAASPVAWR